MTDLRQAAQQALEALQYASTGNRRPEIIGPAITALKAALEQQAEPVAWMVYTQDGQSVYVTDNPTDIQEGQRALPLYTIQLQRPWQGLEAEDLAQIESDEFWQVGNHMAIAVAVEAKLKERNT